MTGNPIEPRFLDNLRRLIPGRRPHRVLVAFSGGLDSTVLLHLLRHQTIPDLSITAAHFDHRMRPDSGEDVDWVVGLCDRWGVPLEWGRAESVLRNETEARAARYSFLRSTAAKLGSSLIATAHHADDQAETILFRIVRGTGLDGLAGIPARTKSGLLRPLLPFWREELADYAGRHGLQWREDSTNESLGPVRNRIRREILPRIEREIAPRARRQLVSLAALARETEQGMRAFVANARKETVSEEGGAILLSRSRLRDHHPAIQSRLIRDLLRGLEVTPTRAGTRRTLAFITGAQSGRELQLPGGVRIRIEFDNALIEHAAPREEEDAPLAIALAEASNHLSSGIRLGGRTYRVEVTLCPLPDEGPDTGAIWTERIALDDMAFPLQLRGRRPGDSLRTSGGTKSLKKLMIERRVPHKERSSRPVLADAQNRVIWVAGVAMAAPPATAGGRMIQVAIHDG